MRQILRKDWHALRRLPLAASALMLLVDGLWGLALSRHWIDQGADAHSPVAAPAEVWSLIIVWGLSGALTGSGRAAERGGSAVPDLPSRTAQRKTLWAVQVLSAGGMLSLTILSSGVIWAALDIAVYRSHMMHTYPPLIETVAIFISFAFMALFAAMTLSLFLDDASGGVLATIITVPVVYVQVAMLADWAIKRLFPNMIDTGNDSPINLLPLLLAGVFAVIFYAVFVHGGSLKTRKYQVGAVAGGTAFLVAAAAFVALAPVIAHFR